MNKTHIIGSDHKYLHTAVLVPEITIAGEKHLLFQERSADIIQGSEICFPGGRFDAETDRSLRDTAIRETCEELGISRNKVRITGDLGTLIAPVGVMVRAFTGILRIKSPDELTIDKSEVAKVFTVPLAWFRDNPPKTYHLQIEVRPFRYNDKNEKEHLLPVKDYALPARYEEPWSGRRHPVFVYPAEQGTIWGITAEIVREYMNLKYN
ncbi:MAG: CoA pyrophosphatase [FCB group bacterium]|nr:CoA pyrophosphatase [FCB group bacterium]